LSCGKQKEFEGKHQLQGSKKQPGHCQSKKDDSLDAPAHNDGSSSVASSYLHQKTHLSDQHALLLLSCVHSHLQLSVLQHHVVGESGTTLFPLQKGKRN
jgi:hypothetical protein